MDNSTQPHDLVNRLPADAVSRVSLEARKEGVYAGLSGGLASAVLGQRLMGFGPKKTLVCGILSGVLSGYYFTQAFTSTALAQLQIEEARLASLRDTQAREPPVTESFR